MEQEMRAQGKQHRGYQGKIKQLEIEKNEHLESLGTLEHVYKGKVGRLEG